MQLETGLEKTNKFSEIFVKAAHMAKKVIVQFDNNIS